MADNVFISELHDGRLSFAARKKSDGFESIRESAKSPEYIASYSRTKKYPTVLDEFGNKKKIRHYCAVPSCVITEYSRKNSHEKYNFFRIPSFKRDPIRRKLWVTALRPNEPAWNPSQWTRVCELHFEGGTPGKMGVPTLNLCKESHSQDWSGQTYPAEYSLPNNPADQSQKANESIHFYGNSSLEPTGSVTSSFKSADYLANRVKLIRNTIYSLKVMLAEDESNLKQLNPNHPLFTEDNQMELLNGDGLILASKQLDYCGHDLSEVSPPSLNETYLNSVNHAQPISLLSPNFQQYPLFCSPTLLQSSIGTPSIATNLFTNSLNVSHFGSEGALLSQQEHGRHSVI